MAPADTEAKPGADPYRGRWHQCAVFELEHARHTVRVAAGIGGAVALIAVMVGFALVFPEWVRQDVSPAALLVVAASLLAAVVGAVRLVSGPSVVLRFDGDIAALVTRSGHELARSPVDELGRQTATCKLSNVAIPAVVLRFPGRRPLRLAVNWPEARMPWRSSTERFGEPTHLVATPLWPTLLEHLQLAAELRQPELAASAPQAPTELTPRPWWRRVAPWSPAAIPIIALLVATVWPGAAEPLPDCYGAVRCCLAVANAGAPVSAQALRDCTAMTEGDEERCAARLAEARNQAAKASVRCGDSVVRRYSTFSWSPAATSVPAPGDQWSPEPQHPRVSCRKAAELLSRAVADERSGPWLVVRPQTLMIQSVTLSDPNAFIYCEGYPLPVVAPKMASDEPPIVLSGGPHAVLLRPRADGRFDLGQYCLGCNSVGKEPNRP